MTPSAKNDNGSPGKFIRPADLFRMRRKSTNTITLTPSNKSNSSNPGANISFHLRSSPLGFKNQPRPPVPMSPNFSRISSAKHIEPQSPLKCLNNMADPSPTKNLPTILKNPFNQPVKRRLNLSPKKGIKSPTKRSRLLGLDEDANLEPPRMKRTIGESSSSPTKLKNCTQNDWTIKTKLKVKFVDNCKNWNEESTSSHRRLSNGQVQESPSKFNDNSISIEAIKNIATVYQHPYMAWMPLFPRGNRGVESKKDIVGLNFAKSADIAHLMLMDWCTSLNDLTNLLIDGKCPYFYMCGDVCNILFKQKPSSIPKRPIVQAFVSPFSYGMAKQLDALQCGYRYPDEEPKLVSSLEPAKENSQASFGSSRSAHTVNLDDSASQDSKQAPKMRMTSSIDSGHCSDLEDDQDDVIEGDTSEILGSFNLSIMEFPSLQSKPKGFSTTDSNTQSRSTSNRPLAIIEGVTNLRKFIKFLQTNRTFIITNTGKHACLPPTLLSPREFRLSTPQVPEVLVSKSRSPSEGGSKSKGIPSNPSTTTYGPSFVEIRGPILPNLHKELHNLLVLSENEDHICQLTDLESSKPFSTILIE